MERSSWKQKLGDATAVKAKGIKSGSKLNEYEMGSKSAWRHAGSVEGLSASDGGTTESFCLGESTFRGRRARAITDISFLVVSLSDVPDFSEGGQAIATRPSGISGSEQLGSTSGSCVAFRLLLLLLLGHAWNLGTQVTIGIGLGAAELGLTELV
jgi:hypothetical protein